MDVITAILGVWTKLVEWFTSTIGDLSTVFYAEGNLTFIGGLAILSIALGIAMLVFNIVKDFLKMRS